jgi:hypothetical protein
MVRVRYWMQSVRSAIIHRCEVVQASGLKLVGPKFSYISSRVLASICESPTFSVRKEWKEQRWRIIAYCFVCIGCQAKGVRALTNPHAQADGRHCPCQHMPESRMQRAAVPQAERGVGPLMLILCAWTKARNRFFEFWASALHYCLLVFFIHDAPTTPLHSAGSHDSNACCLIGG